HPAVGDGVVAGCQVLGCGAHHADVDVAAAELDLLAALHLGRECTDDVCGVATDGVGIIGSERRTTFARHARHPVLPGIDLDQVGTQGVDPLLNGALRASTHRHHGDHRGDADDHSQHREHRAHLVRADATECHLDGLADQHVQPSFRVVSAVTDPAGPSCGSSAPASTAATAAATHS